MNEVIIKNNFMKENRIKVVINKPIKEVFDFTVNPKNTHLWIPSVEEELSDKFPPEVGDCYKNRGKNSDWNFYNVTEFKDNEIFELNMLDENYSVRYTYKKISDNETEMEYFEWVKNGEIDDPFTEDILIKLKSVIEDNI